jgi:hypothetical protein
MQRGYRAWLIAAVVLQTVFGVSLIAGAVLGLATERGREQWVMAPVSFLMGVLILRTTRRLQRRQRPAWRHSWWIAGPICLMGLLQVLQGRTIVILGIGAFHALFLVAGRHALEPDAPAIPADTFD